MEEPYDYIVIGAGIAGLSSAYHLGKDGARVIVLEASDGSDSASMASTAEMNHDPDAEWDTVIEHFGLDGARSLWYLCENGIDMLSEFAHSKGEMHFSAERVPGYIYSYADEGVESLRAKYELYQSIGAYVSFEEYSPLHPSFRAVLTTHGEGVTNNQSLLKMLAHCAREHGGEILHHARVTSLDVDRVTTESGDVYKGHSIIIATGDGAGLLAESLAIERKRTFVVSYEKHGLPEIFKESVMWDTDTPYHYTRSFAGNRLWVGGEDAYESEYTQSPDADEKKYAAIDEYAQKVLGTDDSYARQATWSGLFYPAKRGLPYIGAITGTQHVANVGFGGTGIVTSFLSGYLLAAWKRGELLDYQRFFALDWS